MFGRAYYTLLQAVIDRETESKTRTRAHRRAPADSVCDYVSDQTIACCPQLSARKLGDTPELN